MNLRRPTQSAIFVSLVSGIWVAFLGYHQTSIAQGQVDEKGAQADNSPIVILAPVAEAVNVGTRENVEVLWKSTKLASCVEFQVFDELGKCFASSTVPSNWPTMHGNYGWLKLNVSRPAKEVTILADDLAPDDSRVQIKVLANSFQVTRIVPPLVVGKDKYANSLVPSLWHTEKGPALIGGHYYRTVDGVCKHHHIRYCRDGLEFTVREKWNDELIVSFRNELIRLGHNDRTEMFVQRLALDGSPVSEERIAALTVDVEGAEEKGYLLPFDISQCDSRPLCDYHPVARFHVYQFFNKIGAQRREHFVPLNEKFGFEGDPFDGRAIEKFDNDAGSANRVLASNGSGADNLLSSHIKRVAYGHALCVITDPGTVIVQSPFGVSKLTWFGRGRWNKHYLLTDGLIRTIAHTKEDVVVAVDTRWKQKENAGLAYELSNPEGACHVFRIASDSITELGVFKEHIVKYAFDEKSGSEVFVGVCEDSAARAIVMREKKEQWRCSIPFLSGTQVDPERVSRMFDLFCDSGRMYVAIGADKSYLAEVSLFSR